MRREGDRPAGDPFAVAPYSPRERRIHTLGVMLNAAGWLAGVAWLAVAWGQAPPALLGAVLAVLAGIYAADLLSGVLHWAFDTWFDDDIAFIRRMVLQVREHHIHPGRIFKIHFTQDAGTLSWIALLLTAPWLAAAWLAGPGSWLAYPLAAAVVFDPLLVFMLEFHKCGHRPRGPAWVRVLQRLGLVLPVGHHLTHHSGNHDVNYCLINGWADRTLGRLGLFRGLERLIQRTTGAEPQRDDEAWFRRFGRPLPGRGAPE